jgi:predicted porin
MKKTLAIAIAAGLAAPIAVMADTTLYGSLHNSIDIVDDGSASNNVSRSNNKSSIGVKGSEKITDGLSAVYKVEFGPDLGGNGGTLNNRDQYVGLSGEYGTLVSGRASTPYKIVGAKADLFWFSQLGTNRTITGPNIRADNVIAYFTPKMGGFKAAIAHVTEGAGNGGAQNDAFTAWSGNAFYTAGGLMVGAGFENIDGGQDAVRLMASYDTGKFKVVGFAEDVNPDGNNNDTSNYGLGASVKTGKGAVKGQYYTSNPDGDNNDSSLLAIGYDHNLSKRTTVYAQYATVDNDDLATTRLGQGGRSDNYAPNAAGDTVSGISLGIKHDF